MRIVFVVLGLFVSVGLTVSLVYGWGNGSYSSSPEDYDTARNYGTHDWIAQHAWAWTSSVEGMPALNLTDFLYGTELPDRPRSDGGINDKDKHHVYFFANGSVQDGASAQRAQEELDKAVNFSRRGDLVNASLSLGMMTHYISDVASFGHVMGNKTVWGAEDEEHHKDYEEYVNARTNTYASNFTDFLVFDGILENISAYDATMILANDTTFDSGGVQNCTWMDQNYNWSDPIFENRCGESLNNAVNAVADVLHMFDVRTRFLSDVNGDGRVDMKDVSYVAKRFWCVPGDVLWDAVADVNGDGRIDVKDIGMVARHFLEHI